MITVAEALALVRAEALPLAPRTLPAADCLGLALAEPVDCDLDSPPYDKSLVDGYALSAAELVDGAAELEVIERVTAGQVPSRALGPGQAIQIMTGAPLPQGADTVAMVENTTTLSGGAIERVQIRNSPLAPGRNVLRQAASMRAGDRVLPTGALLGPAQLGLAAEVGRSHLAVIPAPSVAVLSTGNELVPPDHRPGPGQIRNSNGIMLSAQARALGCPVLDLGIAGDDEAALAAAIARGLEARVLVLSGGVSAGVLDLVPSVLEQLGVRQVFHKVRLKPGKPLWFGVRASQDGNHLVFGLPGNPVSSFVCWELLVAPAIAALAGRPVDRQPGKARLRGEFLHRGDRPTYHPAVLVFDHDGPQVELVRWQGSADLRGLAQANVLVHFPAGDRHYPLGQPVEVLDLPLVSCPVCR